MMESRESFSGTLSDLHARWWRENQHSGFTADQSPFRVGMTDCTYDEIHHLKGFCDEWFKHQCANEVKNTMAIVYSMCPSAINFCGVDVDSITADDPRHELYGGAWFITMGGLKKKFGEDDLRQGFTFMNKYVANGGTTREPLDNGGRSPSNISNDVLNMMERAHSNDDSFWTRPKIAEYKAHVKTGSGTSQDVSPAPHGRMLGPRNITSLRNTARFA